MKKNSLFFALFAVIAFVGCKNNNKASEPITEIDSTEVVAEAPPMKAEFQPFNIAEISHTVKDYATWKKGFDNDSTAQKANGLEFIIIGRTMEKPNNLMIFFKASDVQKAKDFTTNPGLKEAMQKSGVISKPEFGYYNVLRFNEGSNEKQWVVVTHKVKDFDSWLKVYDEEGTAKRAEQGLVDVVLARGIDDPNTVQIILDITDMDKAKAHMNSPEIKKIMESAGVIGKPKIEFFNSAE